MEVTRCDSVVLKQHGNTTTSIQMLNSGLKDLILKGLCLHYRPFAVKCHMVQDTSKTKESQA